ncbi:hypothetical protein [Bosea sp. R86505]|jgi:hypothetical protein|uniref:hypothetical protein n=1 Tax=Bosea sp. R86505 TaxID=3101710 RepID=UPI00366E442A
MNSMMIASPSLRGAQRRSNPGAAAPYLLLDCFAALAMTAFGGGFDFEERP